MAKIDPGEAAAPRPAPRVWKTNVPETPPAMAAKNSAGFIMT